MKKLSLLLALVLLLGTFAGCNTDPADPADSTDPVSDSESDSVSESETAPPEPEIPQVDQFHLEFGEPVVVGRAPVSVRNWGSYQFPSLSRTLDGHIYAGWTAAGSDTIEYKTTPANALSTDGGKTWVGTEGYNTTSAKRPMENGCYFVGFIGKGAHAADWIKKYEPAYTAGKNAYYFLADLPKNEDTRVTAREYDPKTGQTSTFECTINWPHAALVELDGKVYPITQMFALSNRAMFSVDGVLYLPLYFRGFDCTAETREDAFTDYINVYHIYLFKSVDSGRTWDFYSQVHTDETIKGSAEGLCEPEITVVPDGSWVMLMRTGGSNPSYITRSADMGATWSQPVQFDTIGVLPQLVTLDCGVTIASYGRPEMHLRATSDPAGLEWEDVIYMKLSAPAGTKASQTSCFYTDLIALDPYTALFIYSDFKYPNEDGEPAKTILVRTVTVVPD